MNARRMRTLHLVIMAGMIAVGLTGCFWIEDRPAPTLDSVLGTYYFDYYSDNGTAIRYNNYIEVIKDNKTLSLEIKYDTADVYTLIVEDVKIMKSGIAFNIPNQSKYSDALNASYDVEGKPYEFLQETTWYDGYITKGYIEFKIGIDFIDPEFAKLNSEFVLIAFTDI